MQFPNFRKNIKKIEKDSPGECRIKFKQTKTGSEVIFSPACTKSQIEMAKEKIRESREEYLRDN